MSTSQIEIERKYEAPADATPELGDLKNLAAGDTTDHDLDATYYDTTDHALAAHRAVLRRRRGGTDEGWHVKFTLEGSRHEVHFPLLKDRSSMPAAVRTLVSAMTLGEPLHKIADVATHRVRTALLDESGVEVAELCDDSVTATDHATGTERSWREWEVELLVSDLSEKRQDKIFRQMEKVLSAAGAKPSTAIAKIARATGQDRTFDRAAGIDVAEPTERSEGASTLGGGQRLVSELVSPLLADIQVFDVAVRSKVPEAVQHLRTRLRTTRSILLALRGGIADEAYASVVEGAKAASQALGAARDVDVVRDVLEGSDAWPELTGNAKEHILKLLSEDENTAWRNGYSVLDSEEYRTMLVGLGKIVDNPPLVEWAQDLSAKKLGSRMMDSLNEQYRKRIKPARKAVSKEADDAVDSLNEVRRAARDLRYVIESLDEADRIRKKQRDEAGEAHREAKSVQHEVGHMLDLRLAVEWLDHAARIFQRRSIDRYAIGILTGQLQATLALKLAEGFRSLAK